MLISEEKHSPVERGQVLAKNKHMVFARLIGSVLLSELFLALLSGKLHLRYLWIPQIQLGKLAVCLTSLQWKFSIFSWWFVFFSQLCALERCDSLTLVRQAVKQCTWVLWAENRPHRYLIWASARAIHKNDWNPARPIFGNTGLGESIRWNAQIFSFQRFLRRFSSRV